MEPESKQAPVIYMGGRAVNILLAPVAVTVLPGLLGEDGYGQYGYWFGLISIYLVLLDMGIQPLLRRYLPELIISHPHQTGAFFLTTQRLKLIPFFILLCSVPLSSSRYSSLVLILSALAASLFTNLSDIYYAYEKMTGHVTVLTIRRLLRLILVPMLYVLWGLNGILSALLLTETVSFLLSLPAVRLLSFEKRKLQDSLFGYYHQGIFVFLAFLFSTTLGRLPVLYAKWNGLSEAGIGKIALCVDLTYFALKELINSISESILPRLVSRNTSGQTRQFDTIIVLNFKLVNAALLCCTSVGAGLSLSYLPLLGGEFYQASGELQLLIASTFFGCWNLIHSQILLSKNKSQYNLLAQSLGLLVAVACYVFIPGKLTIFTLSLGLFLGTAAACLTSYIAVKPFLPAEKIYPSFMRQLPGSILIYTMLTVMHPTGLWPTAAAGVISVCLFGAYCLWVRGIPTELFADLKDLILRRKA